MFFYDNYKNRLENSPAHTEKSKGHRHNMAIRYMVKMFIIDLYKVWRTVEGSGLSGFLQYLLDFDISKFDIRALPETAARTEQKEFMFDTGMTFLAWALRRGAFYDGFAYEDSSDFL